jgi:predicted PurR-regulated permease PerM
MSRPITIHLSTQTLFVALLLVVATLLIVTLRDVVLVVFVASVLSAAMDPSITLLERRGLPRPVGLTILMLMLIGVLVVLVYTFVPVVVEQTQQFLSHMPEIYQRNLDALRRSGNAHIATAVESMMLTVQESAGTAARTFFGGALTVVRGVGTLFAVIVLTMYMAMQQQELKAGALELAPPRLRPRISRLLREIKGRLGHWLLGQLALGAVIGVVSYFGLLVFGVKFALVLAVLAGITELIPIVGPIIGAIPAVIVAASDEPIKGLWVGLMYIAIQQLENHLLVPRIMARATGLSPITVIIALLIGGQLAGLLGVFIAVPASIIAQVLMEDWVAGRKLKEQEAVKEPTAAA